MLMLTFRQDVIDDERLEQELHLIQVSLESLLSGHWTKTLPHGDSINTQEALAHMSSRQLEIINLLVENLTSAQMARSLHVSESTVKQELSRIFKMLGVNDRAQARLVYLAVLAGGRVLREREITLG
jgi:DNA-binding NarL/FixJ family response regulator